MRDFRDAKAMARTLREALAAQGVTITNSASLELTARMLGRSDSTVRSATDSGDGPVVAMPALSPGR